MKLLVTGGAGFIGSHFIIKVLNNVPGTEVINLDLLTYAGNLENLKEIEAYPNYKFVKGNITDRALINELVGSCDAVVNFAAESHVDRSILGPEAFVQTNLVGTQVLLEACRSHKVKRFLQVSTDEVYGSLGTEGKFTESSNLEPNSPYSASKAGADLLCRAYHHTFGMDVIVTRCSNNYGPNQFPEKFLPLMINNAVNNLEIPVYGDGLNVRDWIYVEDHCDAVITALQKGKAGEVYNISAHEEWKNLDLVKLVLSNLKKPESLIKFVKDRPGHDRRYALDSSKLRNELGWKPKFTFQSGLAKTINWYLENTRWLTSVTSGSYQSYYSEQYSL